MRELTFVPKILCTASFVSPLQPAIFSTCRCGILTSTLVFVK